MNTLILASLDLLRQIAEPILREDAQVQKRVLDFIDSLINEIKNS
jgi:hypothetical protein